MESSKNSSKTRYSPLLVVHNQVYRTTIQFRLPWVTADYSKLKMLAQLKTIILLVEVRNIQVLSIASAQHQEVIGYQKILTVVQ